MESSNKIGGDFEKRFAKKTGSQLVPGSGSQWHSKMDATHGPLVFSLKRTTKSTFTVNSHLFDELDRATSAPGGYKDSLPALCISAGDMDDLVVMRLDDFMALQTSYKGMFKASKSEEKIEEAKTPILLRNKDGR